MSAYYNEHDPGAAAWLRELIADGQIAAGDVDERSITDVQPGDLAGYTQCHFFAGIGGWSLALRLAGWPNTRPVWTGSCPCQPFSAAGKGQGGADHRHLWPAWFRLIRECRPEHVFGEQVAAAIGHGWLDLVSADLEGEGYAFGAHVLGAHSVGAPHRRQRLWFVANTESQRRQQQPVCESSGVFHASVIAAKCVQPISGHGAGAGVDGAAESKGVEHERRGRTRGGWRGSTDGRVDLQLGHADDTRPQGRDGAELPERAGECVIGAAGAPEQLADADGWDAQHGELQRRGQHGLRAQSGCADGDAGVSQQSETRRVAHSASRGQQPLCREELSPWTDLVWLPCRDGKSRPTQSGLFPLVARLPRGVVPSGDPSESEAQASAEARVMRLRGYGNAIAPQVAAEMIRAYMDITEAA